MEPTDDAPTVSPLNLVMQMAGEGSRMEELGRETADAMLKANADAIGTLHEARFVRLDERTIALFTSYDGSFHDYILDFTKHMAEVFNLVLPKVADPPPLPVEKNVQAFEDWARKHDVPSLAYYRAYPDLSVQDVLALEAKG